MIPISRNSVRSFPRERIRDITSERLALVNTSVMVEFLVGTKLDNYAPERYPGTTHGQGGHDMSSGKRWGREELLLILNLYFRIPFVASSAPHDSYLEKVTQQSPGLDESQRDRPTLGM